MEQLPQYQVQPPPGIPTRDASAMTLKDWIITLLLQAIPLVGFILLIVWAVDNNTNINKQNWARATLIIFAVVVGIMIVVFIFMFGVIASLFNLENRY